MTGWLSLALTVLLVGGLSRWLRRLAKRADDYYEREHKTPTILDQWLRGGP